MGLRTEKQYPDLTGKVKADTWLVVFGTEEGALRRRLLRECWMKPAQFGRTSTLFRTVDVAKDGTIGDDVESLQSMPDGCIVVLASEVCDL